MESKHPSEFKKEMILQQEQKTPSNFKENTKL